MAGLRICLLGPLEISYNKNPLAAFPTQKSKNLFAYLALHHDRLWEREALASLFWQDSPPASARKCLRTELWRIRTVLSSAGNGMDGLLTIDKGRVGFCKAPNIWLDVDELEQRFKSAENRSGETLKVSESQYLLKCIELYRGDFLEGSYENWAINARERFKNLFISILVKLLEFHRSRGEWSAAITFAREALSHDPFLENVHREMMSCLWQMGRRAAALHQHSQYAELLKRELGVEPMQETIDLYEQIRRSSSALPPRILSSSVDFGQQASEVGMDRLLIHLTALQNHLGEVDRALREMVQKVKEISPQAVNRR